MSLERKSGFSLMEVNLAILLVSIGLITLFGLFPFALKQATEAISDTKEAMFADTVLSMIEGNAFSITNWNDWTDDATFYSKITQSISELNGTSYPDYTLVEFPASTGEKIRYKMDIIGGSTDRRKRVMLEVAEGVMGRFNSTKSVYSTDLIYMGM